MYGIVPILQLELFAQWLVNWHDDLTRRGLTKAEQASAFISRECYAEIRRAIRRFVGMCRLEQVFFFSFFRFAFFIFPDFSAGLHFSCPRFHFAFFLSAIRAGLERFGLVHEHKNT